MYGIPQRFDVNTGTPAAIASSIPWGEFSSRDRGRNPLAWPALPDTFHRDAPKENHLFLQSQCVDLPARTAVP